MRAKFKSDGSTASYYELPEGSTELQHLISHRNMNAQIGEIFRACYRYGLVEHSEMLRDAKKIAFYAKAEIERLEKLAEKESSPALSVPEPKDIKPQYGAPRTPVIGEDVDFEPTDRQKKIEQSGEMAEEVYAAIDGKPDWKKAPEKAKYLAQDMGGQWFWYTSMPKKGSSFWYGADSYVASVGTTNPNWRDTLEARPQ